MISLTNLFTILLPLSATVALSSHLPPPIKRAGHHDKARKNFQHIHSNENNSTLVPRGTTYTGTGTFYYTGLGACGQYSKDSDYMVALNSAQYGSGYPGPQCFKGITIQANGNTVSGVTIMDECPTCGYGSLDLSPGLFKQFASEDAGVISITWWFNDDSSEATTTSQTPTSTYVAPTSTYNPPTSTWVEPTSTYTPPTSTWTPPASSSATTTSQAAPSSITSTSAAVSSSTITSSALSSTASSIIAHNTTNPYVVISSNSTAASVTAGVTTETDGEDSEGSEGVSVTVTGNIEGLNGLVAQYGQLVVVAAEAA
ncbi:hypothetical protein I203_101488 [Kwoniella mangroviensis CBS 8507]|uniref:uncharacterized protein n=1 Tax=Kwoniella mangroviensis CBS 8507 TaxID=1296122 RepID=UPI00080D30BF|nr:uncharacterized protein I203_05540 [Kwoniella mangroviensis CBS 8507]OCF65294.1 hypothetical protein I203_05540 [Kwoniella mangroviensis CBS 8507]